MRWLLTSPQRALQRRQQARRDQQAALLRAGLLEALTPLAEALRRLDQRILVSQMQQVELHQEVKDLQMEVLSSLQPSASQQLLPRLESTQPYSHRRSVS